ncbi:MAG: nucleoside deaminase [Deltaproteobacteria bacterium]|nr:nucleoside deaminase [Deltaproteobacteria bacterium]
MSPLASDEKWMLQALQQAQKAAQKNEVPIGAIAVYQNKIIARAHNLRESKQDPLGHAEIYLLSKVAKKLACWRMSGVTIYVTLEPCLMCMGALMQARVDRLVFGCLDAKAGACGSLYDFSKDLRLNHRIEVRSGVLQKECVDLLSGFFKQLRQRKMNRSGLMRKNKS